ncbi:LysR family transcriptional regulator [Microvirga sp. TS319]|uniref:LysR family transcriptional regulator n=1 Tax=Microvirga sp. TS319 TaxID=3241165 RepID=UPI00351A3AB3
MRLLDRTAGQLNWNLLRTFLIIVEERSITRAADRLSLRQPSVSAALRRLEETLNCQLIERDSRRFTLTEQGEILYRECDEIYRRVCKLGEKLNGVHNEISGLVRLLLVTQVIWPELDRTIAALHREHNRITFKIEIANSQEIVRAVAQRIAPFGICLLTKPVPGLNCQMLFREEFGLYCGANYHLSERATVTIDELQAEPWVSFTCAETGTSFEPMNALRDSVGLGHHVVASSPHLEELQRLIGAGIGIGLLPSAAVEASVYATRLKRLPFEHRALGADLYLVTNPSQQLEKAEAAFLEMLMGIASDRTQEIEGVKEGAVLPFAKPVRALSAPQVRPSGKVRSRTQRPH